ncbi:MAG: prolyl oligopeptidase family serine peptidase [Acidimicrobiales bacterium]
MNAELSFGSWPSPISASLVASGGVGVGRPAVRGGQTWWSELRPTEGGRSVLVVRETGDGEGSAEPSAARDVLAAPWSARTRVHEYGGGAWWLGRDHAYFANWDDQRLYRVAADGASEPSGAEPGSGESGAVEPEAITAEPSIAAGWRYADGREHPDGQWLVSVREDHHGIGSGDKTEAANEIVGIPLTGGFPAEPVVLVSGPDFVAAPRFSPDGRWLSWVQWDHPNMPWEATTLCAAPVFANMRLGNVQTISAGASVLADTIADGDIGESIHGADWTADGRLVFSSDSNGYWNLYSWSPGGTECVAITALDSAEIGGPAWNFGVRRWTELENGRLAVVITTDAVDSLATVDGRPGGTVDRQIGQLSLPEITVIAGPTATTGNRVVMMAAGPKSLSTIVEIDLGSGQMIERRPADDTGVDRAWFSTPQAISYPSGDRQAHAFFYPPTGADVSGPSGALPPLIVMGHGGPTAHAAPALNLKIQYWTSRGFAVVDVNYGGSSGFGRAYRELLRGSWGIVDVEDCISATEYLASAGHVDEGRLAIRGGSAGGFTVLAVLEASDAFAAGTSLYGVADLTALAADTHKFESRYLDRLVGPYPERKDLYEERSPINHTDRLTSPLLVLQGLEDEIVPPNQSEAIVAALAAKGVPHAYVPFEGEQHGFRRAENIIRSLEVELWFYGRILGFEPADVIEPAAGAVGLD